MVEEVYAAIDRMIKQLEVVRTDIVALVLRGSQTLQEQAMRLRDARESARVRSSWIQLNAIARVDDQPGGRLPLPALLTLSSYSKSIAASASVWPSRPLGFESLHREIIVALRNSAPNISALQESIQRLIRVRKDPQYFTRRL